MRVAQHTSENGGTPPTVALVGTLVEQFEGVSRASLILHEDDLLQLGVLVDKLGGVLEAAQCGRREGTKCIDEYDLKGA